VLEGEQLERAGEERLQPPDVGLPARALGGAVPQLEGGGGRDGDVVAPFDGLLQAEADPLPGCR